MGGATISGHDLASDFLFQARDRLQNSCTLIRHCVGQLSLAELWWRPCESQNSVANLVLHVTGNLRQRIVAVVGGQPNSRDRAQEFAQRERIAGEQLMNRLQNVLEECDAVLASLTAAQLRERRSYRGINRQFDLDALSVILHTLLHLAGHAQEIVFMTRLQLGDDYRFANPPAERK